jgi:small-conductance mechanosensitive channel
LTLDRLRRALCGIVLTLWSGMVAAQAVAPAVPPAAQLTQAERDLATVDRQLDDRLDRAAQKALRDKAVTAQQTAEGIDGDLSEQLALIDARVAGLGPVERGVAEPPEITQQRARLAGERRDADAATKRARLIAIEARQLIEEIDRGQAQQFSQRIATRAASPLVPAFWRDLKAALPRDLRRIRVFVAQGGDQIRAQWRGGLPWQAMLGAVVALALLFPVRLAGRALGRRMLIDGAPGHRVRRTGNALWRVLVGTLSPLLAAAFFVQGLRWSGLLPERWSGLLDAFVGATGFSAFTTSILGALLMRHEPSWRVAPIDDETAIRLRPLSWALAGVAMSSILLGAFNTAVGASPAAAIATEAFEALLHLSLVVAFLIVLGRLRAERSRRTEREEDLPASAGLAAATVVVWLLVIGAIVALLLGYVGFGLFVAQLIAWATVLGATLYLLMVAADDVATTIVTRDSRFGRALVRALGVRPSTIDQIGLLLSGALRLSLIVVGIGLLLTPFGSAGGLGALFGRLGSVAQGVQIGGVAISPGAIVRGLVVLFVGLSLVRLFMTWLETRYLPVTDLDGSGRNSVTLVARYVGIAVAGIWALASLGIGVERIALLLSALSVGIGFGLQAITQNFVSGLILLAERPIKIGDLVRVGTDEGDVKRISVRSTEIELADHSTLIVPNSELITKSVLNKTLAGPLGRIQVQFSVPLESDAAAVRAIVLAAFAAEEAVLAEPAPAAFVDSIADGRIFFNCLAHTASPRTTYGARSNVLMALLRRFREEDITVGTVPQRLELVAPPPLHVPPA